MTVCYDAFLYLSHSYRLRRKEIHQLLWDLLYKTCTGYFIFQINIYSSPKCVTNPHLQHKIKEQLVQLELCNFVLQRQS